MKFLTNQYFRIVGSGRAPQGARGLKYLFFSKYFFACSVAPRKGRVG